MHQSLPLASDYKPLLHTYGSTLVPASIVRFFTSQKQYSETFRSLFAQHLGCNWYKNLVSGDCGLMIDLIVQMEELGVADTCSLTFWSAPW
jgi:hypothetical protein